MNSKVKIVTIGGGSGLSVLLRGLKKYTQCITAIVTVADDGGGSGVLREDLGMLPPGDLRNCILALANTEPVMEQLLQYRFDEGLLKGQNFGNLLIAAMDGISNSFEEAIQRVNDIFAVTGQVLPATVTNVELAAVLKDGSRVIGESIIPVKTMERDTTIDKVFLMPENAQALPEAIHAIKEADLIIYGPGSLYTSVIPNLLLKDIINTLEAVDVPKIYISNLMTQPGETDGYSVSEHVKALIDHTSPRIIDHVVVNNGEIPEKVVDKYLKEKAQPLYINESDEHFFKDHNIKVLLDDFTEIKKMYLRHNADKVSNEIVKLVETKRYSKNIIKHN